MDRMIPLVFPNGISILFCHQDAGTKTGTNYEFAVGSKSGRQ